MASLSKKSHKYGFFLFAFFIIILFSLPLLKLFSFSEKLFLHLSYTKDIVHHLANDAQFYHAFLNTITIATSVTLLSGLLGVTLSLFVGLLDTHRLHVWSFIVFLVLFLPPTFLAIAWIDVGTLMNFLLSIDNPMYTKMATILLLSIHLFPVAFFVVIDQLKRIPSSLIDVAKSMGTPPKILLLKIVWPLLRASIVKACMLIWFSCLGHFTFFALLGIPGQFSTLTTLIYTKLIGFGMQRMDEIVLLCLMLMIIGGLGILLLRQLSGKTYPLPTTSKQLQNPTFDSKLTHILMYSLLSIICLSIMLPMIKLLLTSFTAKNAVSSSWLQFSLENYVYIFNNPSFLHALMNSLIVAVSAGALLFFKSSIFEFGARLTGHRFFRRVRFCLQILYLMPGSILAIGMILFFLSPFDWMRFLKLNLLYNTLFMILIAYVIRFFAFHLNIVHAGSENFSIRLFEAAKSCGAPLFSMWRRIFLPLMFPNLLNGSFLVFILIMHEVTIASLLPSSKTQTIGVVLLSLMEHGDTKAAASLCMIVTFLLVFCRLLMHHWTKRAFNRAYNMNSSSHL